MKSYQYQRVPSSVGTYKQCHTRWRDHTLARWFWTAFHGVHSLNLTGEHYGHFTNF